MASNNNIDITKTGPQGYRQLQDTNEDPFIGIRPQPMSPTDMSFEGEQYLRSPLADTGTAWGESMWDNNTANQAEFERLGDIRAENQPWFAKISAGLAKGAVLAGTTFLNGTLGLVYGIGSAIKNGRWSGLWDNDFSRAMNQLNESSEQLMPNYYTQEEAEGPWYNNIFTANFWGDKFLKNIGFTVGAFYSGGLYSKGLGALMQAVKAGTKMASAVTTGTGAIISAVNEGSMEALNAANDFEQKYKSQLDEQLRQRLAAIQAEFDANKGKELIAVGPEGNQLVDPAYERYQAAVNEEKDNYNKAIAKLQEDKAKVGNATLLMNIPILTASNIYQFGKLYSRGFNTSRRTLDITGDIGKYEAKHTGKAITAAKIVGGGLSEGAEEVEQQVASDAAQNYYAVDVNNFYRSLQDPDAAEDTLDWTKTFGETLASTLSEGSTWEQFFIGGLTGLMGMPRFRSIRNEEGKLQSPIVLEENLFSKWKELREQDERNQAMANEMNQRVNSPEFKNYYQGLIRHNKYQKDMDDAAMRDDEFDYKNAEHAQLLSDVAMFANAGKLDDLKSLVESAYDVSDENLQAIIENTTSTVNKDGKEVKVGPFIDKNGNQMGKEDMVAELTKQKDDILNTIDKYVKTREKLDNVTGQRFTEEQLDELTWLQTQLENWSDRTEQMSGQVKEAIGNVIGRFESYRRAVDAIRQEEGKSSAELSEDYKRADEIIKSIDKAISNLNILRNLDAGSMAATLAKNPDKVDVIKEQIGKIDNTVMNAQDKLDVIKKIDDLVRIGKASQTFSNKLAEYLINPQKQAKDHAKVDEETKNEEIKRANAKKVEALNKTANFQEVESLIANGEVTLDDLEGSSSDAAKDYKKASLFKKKAIELINASDSAHKKELIDMLNRRFNEHATYDDLSNLQLVTDLPLEATTWDNVSQDTLINEFNTIIKNAADKVNSGNSQKKDVAAKPTGTKKPANVGHDDVGQAPASKPFSVDSTVEKIDKSNLPDEVKAEAKGLVSQVAKNIEALEKGEDVKLLRQTQRALDRLQALVGSDAAIDLANKVQTLSKAEVFNPGTQDEALRDNENSEHAPTEVTGVMKATVPQFDLDAKKDGKLVPFVEEVPASTGLSPDEIRNEIQRLKNDKELEKLINKALSSTDKAETAKIEEQIKQRLPEGFSYTRKPDGKGFGFAYTRPANQSSNTGTRTRNSGYKYVYDKLSAPIESGEGVDIESLPKEALGKSAFDYVNEGYVKEGDELEVRYEPATNEHPELLGLYHNGVLVNYMNTDEAVDGVKDIKEKAKKAKADGTSNPTVRVSKIMDGSYGHDRTKTQSVGELLGADDATLGVMKNRTMSANTGKAVEPVFDEANSDGKVYILLPNSKGTLSPKRVYVRHFNRNEFDLSQDNPIANDLRKTLDSLSKLGTVKGDLDTKLDDLFIDLADLLYLPDSFHINVVTRGNETSLQIAFADRNGKRQNRNILLKRAARQAIFSVGANTNDQQEDYVAPVDEVYKQIVDAFHEANLAFNINAKKLAGKDGQAYANRLRDSNVLATYLTGKRMQGTWFLLNEKPNSTHKSSFERAKASSQAKGGTRVTLNGREYFVRNGTIYDETGSIVDLEESKAREIKDIAYINSAYGNSYYGVNQHDGKVLIIDKNGKRGYNRNTGKYMDAAEVADLEATLEGRKEKANLTATAVQAFQESQKLVLKDDSGKPDTSKGTYQILEEDGKYHEYERVHTVIGSNYIGPDKGDNATRRGSLVDEVARQFLADPASVRKPDEMSEEAFGALIRGLGKFREYANRKGLVLVTGRTVVFHKYADGRRIAGELDVFAYNPVTGDITIFDFKTSQYSTDPTKNPGFSKVSNPKMFSRSNKAQYTLQLSAYARLFEDSFGIPVSNLEIVPFQIRYSKDKEGGIARVYPEEYVPLTFQKDVFDGGTPKEPATQKKDTPLRTVKGQYVSTSGGKVEYHQADMQALFTTQDNKTFYLAKVGDKYKLILPNGRAMTIDEKLISDEPGRTRSNIMDFVMSEDVANAINEALKSNPLENSPYGKGIEVTGSQPEVKQPEAKKPVEANKPEVRQPEREVSPEREEAKKNSKKISRNFFRTNIETIFQGNNKKIKPEFIDSLTDDIIGLYENNPNNSNISASDLRGQIAELVEKKIGRTLRKEERQRLVDVAITLLNNYIKTSRLNFTPAKIGDGSFKESDIHLTVTHQGYSDYFKPTEADWKYYTGDMRNQKEGWQTYKGMVYYKKDIPGRGGDNTTWWFNLTSLPEGLKSKLEEIINDNSNSYEEKRALMAAIIKDYHSSNDRMKAGLEALERLEGMKPTTPVKKADNQEAVNKREQDKKQKEAAMPVDINTPMGRSFLANKKWKELTDAEKAVIMPVFEGMTEEQVQEYWDGTDALQRETFIPSCK